MDKRLMQELGDAINDSLSESDRIAEAIGEICKAGYDVFLVLEATVGFNRHDENADDEEGGDEATARERTPPPMREPKPLVDSEGNVNIKLTSQDHRFLRALKIATDNRNNGVR
jgi:hypothetical protein